VSCAGPKGTGKTFQTELAFKEMKMEAVVMSSGVPSFSIASKLRSVRVWMHHKVANSPQEPEHLNSMFSPLCDSLINVLCWWILHPTELSVGAEDRGALWDVYIASDARTTVMQCVTCICAIW
jgi:hypothetical protein